MWAVVIGLAAFRLYRVTGRDEITQWFHGAINAAARKNPIAGFVNGLISCAWCVGFWYALALTGAGALLDLYGPGEAAVIWLAASGVCGLLERLDQLMEATTQHHERL